MVKLERWEKYYLAVMFVTLIIVLLIVFIFIPGFYDYLIHIGWYDRRTIIFFICLLVIGPFMLVYLIILLIKRKK